MTANVEKIITCPSVSSPPTDKALVSEGTNPAMIIKQDDAPDAYKKIIVDFLKALNYTPPRARGEAIDLTINPTYQFLLAEFAKFDNGEGWFKKMCLEATALTEFPFPEHSVEVKRQIARFIWYIIYIDDLGHKMPCELKAFQHNILAGRSPKDSILRGFHENLIEMSRYWDTIAANCITVAALDFVTGYLIEGDPTIKRMKASPFATSWPNYLRVKTGCSPAFVFFIYPTASVPDVSSYIQMAEDIRFYLDYANDLLSFHKETLAGEQNNYIHYRAQITGKSTTETLGIVAKEVLDAHSRISKALQDTEANESWKLFAQGVLDYHLSVKRYRLDDLGF